MPVFRFLISIVLGLIVHGVAQAAGPVDFHKFYAGKIGDRYAFTMDLKNLQGTLTGTYRYAGKPVAIYLQGKLEPSGAFSMSEGDSGKPSGAFSGTLTGKQIAGMWQSGDGARKLSFRADQTSEITFGSKKDIMSMAVGDFSLTSIAGSGGANGMWDTWNDKGRWHSNMSSISGGMREGTQVKLRAADIRLLDSLAIKVGSDLSTRFLANGKTIVTIPYRDAGMQWDVTRASSKQVDQLKQISSGTTVFDEQLYLLARDGVDYSAEINGNFEVTTADVMIVKYAMLADSFEVRFFPESCCGESVFTFTRRRHP